MMIRLFTRIGFVVVAAWVLACNPRPAGRCTVQQDCRDGSVCTDGLCLPEGSPGTCAPACPDDFACHDQVCVASFEPEVAILAPASETYVGPRALPVSASARAPGGVAGVVVRLVRGDAVLAESAAEPFGEGWAASLDASAEEVSEGVAQLVAAVRYGPAGAMEWKSAPVTVIVDRTAPEVVPAADAEWHASPFTVAAQVFDTLSGTEPESVRLNAGLVESAGAMGEGRWFSFALDPAAAAPGAEGEVAYAIAARDRVGNEAGATGTLRLDLRGPTVAPVPDAAWHRFSDAANVFADVADAGSGVRRAWIGSAAGEGAGRFRFSVSPSEHASADVEGPVALTVAAEDMLGNRTEAAATLFVDGRAPAAQIVPDAAWYARGATATVRVVGSDAGSGFVSASLLAAGRPALDRAVASGAAEFAVPLAEYAAADHEGPFAFTVVARDAAGNETVLQGSLNVDGRAPAIALTPDAAWHAREETAQVVARVTDAGSGVDPSSVRVRAGGKTYAGSAAGDAFTISVPLAEIAPAGAEGEVAFEVEARDVRGNARTAAGVLRVDDRAPSITLTWVQSRVQRDGQGNVLARVTDAGAGVDPASARVSAPGMAAVAGAPTANADEYRVVYPASAPTLRAFEAAVTLTFEAADRLGHRATRAGSTTITRALFVFEKPSSGAVTSSPAVYGANVYFGSEDFRVYAVDRRGGAKRWEFQTSGRVTASPAVGAQHVYAASEDGRLYALKLDGTEAWRCPGSSTLGALSSSPALGTTDGEETVFITSSSTRATYAMRGSGFMVDAAIPEVKACLRSIARGGGGRSSAALDGAGGVYVGEATATGGRLVKLSFTKGQDGVWSFSEDWGFTAADQVHGSPALRAGAVLFGADDRRVYQVSGGAEQWSAAALGRVSGSPAVGASQSFVVDEAGRAFALRLADGGTAWEIPVAEAPVRTTPAVGEDGTVYIAAGTKLQARAPEGTLLWEYDAGGAVDGSSPALACDGALYFGAGGKLHAVITDSRGLAGSSWPRFRHDNRNTGNAATAVRNGSACAD